MNLPIATHHAHGNIVQSKPIDLMDIPVGSVVEVKTIGGSLYWITVTRHRRAISGTRHVSGVSVVTTSTSFGQTTQNPVEQYTDREVKLGEQFHIGHGGKTSKVAEATIL